LLVGVLSVSCVTVSPASNSTTVIPGSAVSSPATSSTATFVNAKPILLVGIGMHVEPFGAQVSALVGGQGPEKDASQDFRDPAFFQRQLGDIETAIQIVEDHGGKVTLQAQTPFSQILAEQGSSLFTDLQSRGHEIALHFHEYSHLGNQADALPVETWTAVMAEEIDWLEQAGATSVHYWSGGNLYPGVLEAAQQAGLDAMSDYKNPRLQETDAAVVGVNPWRPTGGPNGTDLSRFATPDPQGSIVYLPEGAYDPQAFARKQQILAAGGNEAYFQYLAESLQRSLQQAQADRVNVFHITIHPGEFRGDPIQPFAVLDRFLQEQIDPLVAGGQVQWATFSQMADAYRQWELSDAATTPLPASTVTPSVSSTPSGFISFVVNVHDFRNPEESGNTLLRLVDLFEQNGVRGDFYFTEPVVRAYQEARSDVIERLRNSEMTISYHTRPPHPLAPGFDQPLRLLSEQALQDALRDYETYRLDLATGGLQTDQAGGYSYVEQVFGRPPVTVSVLNPRYRPQALPIYAEMGAQATVIYHEAGTDLEQPFQWTAGLLVRPSDFSVTRWAVAGGTEEFWWNRPDSQAYNPTNYLQERMATWQAERAPFVTVLIHENNFYRRGETSWDNIYYADRQKTPLSPPYDLNAPDGSIPRSVAEQERIWQAYQNLVVYAARNLAVVTSQDLVALAK
jgi:peptidoglycan/xylan/chitin deacetylase (PgdA/CDA1 family)